MKIYATHRIGFFVAGILFVLGTVVANGAVAATPVGVWETEGGKSRVEIRRCENKLCGTVVWLKEPTEKDGLEKRDRENPDPALKARPILGLSILRDFIPSAQAGVWESGKIYNPEDGETYKCTLTLVDENTLKVRGYIGIPLFGKTQIWKRVK